ncbi:hypothetical protein [Streptomyces sp. NPDC056661]|uniref:hypothetical protein n=1 Tax=Streptomyces sp. NPDC056661 TaxID=3345898 RepID=UPI0036B40E51
MFNPSMSGWGRSRSQTAADDELRHRVLEVVDPVIGHKSGRCPALDPGGRCVVPANRGELGTCEVAAGQTLDEEVRLFRIFGIYTFRRHAL